MNAGCFHDSGEWSGPETYLQTCAVITQMLLAFILF